MLQEYGLEGKVAIVTGAAQGIGRGISLTVAEAGADIVAVDIATREMEQTAGQIRALGRRCLTINADVTKKDPVQGMVERTISEFGKIDILVCNAGKGGRRTVVPLPEHNLPPVSDQDWYGQIDLNLTQILLCARAVGQHMIQRRRGKVIIITSAAAISKFDHNFIYCVSKAAAARFTQTLAREWGPYNINVNAIGPGWIVHERSKLLWESSEEYRKKELSSIPMGRTGTPRDIGLLVVYLASEASDFMTGQNIYIDGGVTAGG